MLFLLCKLYLLLRLILLNTLFMKLLLALYVSMLLGCHPSFVQLVIDQSEQLANMVRLGQYFEYWDCETYRMEPRSRWVTPGGYSLQVSYTGKLLTAGELLQLVTHCRQVTPCGYSLQASCTRSLLTACELLHLVTHCRLVGELWLCPGGYSL